MIGPALLRRPAPASQRLAHVLDWVDVATYAVVKVALGVGAVVLVAAYVTWTVVQVVHGHPPVPTTFRL